MQVKLTTNELKTLIRETMEVLEEVLPDQEQGKIKEFKQEPLEIQRRREIGIRGISPQEAMNRLGLSG